ncbi:ABC transporter ATP-binding protein [Agromyces luteolus]|uniref:ATP-binding cassette domain-containing protein n=1 Tax=Agromyces luteolus TaxID=88373 RepID=A0A7C9HGJ8_9MICO|nr:ATP-binding cassette domain-containing protein [Agromyces luteolus]MUN06326.1 ATP-binding cassette domain-containing protein [Agromyces luteolus]GLK26641.1 ABC transporter ATP-binding protein [Agromyces luteolus]
MLELSNLSKRYGDRLALDDVSFTVGAGRLTGFVGGNGAGKTTTMRIVLGVLAADGGRITLDGSPVTDVDRRRFGYMPEERGLYPKMRVLEQTVYLARLHGWAPAAARRNALDLLERLGLQERVDDTVESLSLGNQQRAQIAAALVHRPEVLVLDEPFSGLDPLAVEIVQAVLTDAARSGAPVLFSSHQLDVVERLCDDLVVIADGRIRAAGSREELRDQHGAERWELLLSGDAGWVRDFPGIRVIRFDGGWALFESESEAARQSVLAEAVSRGEVVTFAREQTTLAQIFKEVVR